MLSRMLNDFAFPSFSPLMRLRDDMNRLFEGFFDDLPAGRTYAATYPGVNLWEDADAAYVEAELPGLSLGDVEVLAMGNELTINGTRKIDAPDGASWHRRERAQGQFSRTLTLPWPVDADKVEATLHDGILTVRLPKTEAAKPKKVKVLTA